MIFGKPDNKHELTIQAQHAGVSDHDHKSNGVSSGWNQSRLMIGNFFMTTTGEMLDCDWKLDLWNAELTGTINTTKGSVSIRALVHSFHIRPNISGEVLITDDGARQVKKLFADLYELTLAKGEDVTFSDAAGGNESFVVEPVADPVPYRFGLPLK